MSQIPSQLQEVADQIRQGERPQATSVRTFLSWFGAERRGWFIVSDIRTALKNVGVTTVPDFNETYLDGTITFESDGAPANVAAPVDPSAATEGAIPEILPTIGGNVSDPTFRVGRLASANKKPLGVPPDCPLKEVITLMLTNSYSQLPVLQGERTVKGMVSWSSIGVRLVLSREAATARDCMEPAHEVSTGDSIFAAIGAIIEHQYVLVRSADGTVTGIVTATDLSVQFQQLAEPFLLLGEVENHLRRLIGGKFTAVELKSVRDDSDHDRDIESVADLTFGEYVRLLERPALWGRLALGIDRVTFVRELDRIRGIRNDVMHFDPDGITDGDLQTIRRFVGFLQKLMDIGAI